MGRWIHQNVMATVATMTRTSATKLPQPYSSHLRFFAGGVEGAGGGDAIGGGEP